MWQRMLPGPRNPIGGASGMLFCRTRMPAPVFTEANKKNAKSKTPKMKKILLTLISALTVAANGYAVLVFNDTFSYPNGPLTTVSSNFWSAHSGATQNAIAVTIEPGI